jgi:hypothetical protein
LLGLSVDVGTKITSPAYGSSADDGNLTLGANITTGNLKIGGAQTDGDIEIGCGNDRLVDGAIRIGNGNTNAAFPITIGATNSKTDMNGSCTFTKQISASLGITSAGAITTTSGAITSASTVSGTTITASTGLVGAYQNKAASASASITTAGVIAGASLALGTGAIGCGAITSSGIITTTSSVASPAYNGPSGNTTAMTVGGNQTTGSITLGGAQTTGDINIGTNSTSDIYIGNAASGTATDTGVCHINKLQVGSAGSVFRQILFGTVAGGAGLGTGTVSFGTTLLATPYIYGSLITPSVNTSQMFSLSFSGISTTGFTYVKNNIILSGTTITAAGLATNESFSWIAYVV